MVHKLAGGVVVIENNKVLLVKDNNGWSLPKGGTEPGETFHVAAAREGLEETGYHLDVKDVAYITEYTSKEYGEYLHVYYWGEILSQNKQEPDEEIVDVRFVTVEEIRDYISFRPWVIPLENWFKDRRLVYYCFDLDKVSVEV
ncbi:NUDIX domain-containing protein [Paucisalibacillus sp. EB02]|uniref:NUDIX domain-containing protein n=1 Tax=Paucisalibacillus sp. EB02 TaxID=1347087 RepID=UPI000694E798|nr:NUDIX domain-containing protein [Paucisalibacillus sp. EB02]